MDFSFLTNLLNRPNRDFATGDLSAFILSVGISLALGLTLSLAYRIYFRDNEPQDANIARGIPLIAPGVTTIFWLIQFSLPLSLGLLGALSFVRFRTPIKRTEDIAFILLTVAGSLACAVNHYLNAFALTGIVILYGFVRNRIAHGRQLDRVHPAVVTVRISSATAQDLNDRLKSVAPQGRYR